MSYYLVYRRYAKYFLHYKNTWSNVNMFFSMVASSLLFKLGPSFICWPLQSGHINKVRALILFSQTKFGITNNNFNLQS